jgi:hypothetical protein
MGRGEESGGEARRGRERGCERTRCAWEPSGEGGRKWEFKTTAGCTIEHAHERGITLRELRLVLQYVEAHCESERWRSRRLVDGSWVEVELKADEVNLYDINEHVVKPATKARGCSLVELFATGPRAPAAFASHAWSHPFAKTVAIVKQHVSMRCGGDEDAPVWICAFALRQNNPGAEIPSDITESPFFRAVKAAQSTLMILGEDGELLTRMCVPVPLREIRRPRRHQAPTHCPSPLLALGRLDVLDDRK